MERIAQNLQLDDPSFFERIGTIPSIVTGILQLHTSPWTLHFEAVQGDGPSYGPLCPRSGPSYLRLVEAPETWAPLCRVCAARRDKAVEEEMRAKTVGSIACPDVSAS